MVFDLVRQQASQPRKGVGGIFDRVNSLGTNPNFALGLGFLQGNPQAGFQNAAFLRQQQQDQIARAQAARAQAAQRAFENQIAQAKLALDRQKAAEAPTGVQEALFAAGGDEAAARDFLRQKALKPLTSVQVQGEQQTEFAKALGRQQGEKFATMQSEAAESQNQLNSLAQLEQLLEQGIATGPIAQAALPIQQFASDIGIDVNNKRVAQQETFRTITNQLALRLRNPESGLGLTGNTSDRDVRFLKESVPGLDKTEAGNRLIIEFARRAAERKVQAAQLAEQYVAENGSLTGFSSFLSEWAKNNPMFTEEDAARVEAAKAADDAPASGPASGNVVIDIDGNPL